ncbi:hypothetical protein [Enorma phocaeensis]|nr:hypothetical protein [Enorma phocaeensis]
MPSPTRPRARSLSLSPAEPEADELASVGDPSACRSLQNSDITFAGK